MYYFSFFLALISVINGLSVSGNIYDIDTNNPIESVNIFIDELRIGTSSDNNGYFQLGDLPSGEHKLFFSIIGYKSFSKTLDFDNVDQLSIEIKLLTKSLVWSPYPLLLEAGQLITNFGFIILLLLLDKLVVFYLCL